MLFFLVFLVLLLVYLYFKRTYFTLRPDLPGLSPQIFFGNLLHTGVITDRNPISKVLKTFKERYGDIFQFWFGPIRYVMVNETTDVQHIFTNRNIYDQGDLFINQMSILFPDGLICVKGAAFKRHAALTMPLFRRNRVTQHLDLIIIGVDQLLTRWRQRPEGQIHTDIFEQMQDLLLQIFGLIGFDYDLQLLESDQGKTTNELTLALQEISKNLQFVMYTPPWFSRSCLKLSRRYRQAQATVKKCVYQIIDQQLQMQTSDELCATRKRTSLIASLIGSLQTDEAKEALKNEDEKKGLSRREILNEMVMFLAAASDTTTTALAWFIHLMSKYPRVQEKIKAELVENSAMDHLTVEKLDSLPYLDCVIKEVLRYQPPALGTTRTLTMDDRLPKSGIELRKGDSVFIPLHNLAHDPRYWVIDPNTFYPERFLGPDKDHHSYASIPFGAGHRQCIGENLALFEFKVIAARLMQQLTFGDGGPELNAGGDLMRITVLPRKIGVSFKFA